jgi:hypothetical protein
MGLVSLGKTLLAIGANRVVLAAFATIALLAPGATDVVRADGATIALLAGGAMRGSRSRSGEQERSRNVICCALWFFLG